MLSQILAKTIGNVFFEAQHRYIWSAVSSICV